MDTTRGSWERAPLRDLLSQEAAPHAADQVTLQGPDIQVEPRQALALGMIFHELATNAAKYGALSTAAGRVVLTSRRLGDTQVLIWSETGGPIVQAPQTTGFGFFSQPCEAFSRPSRSRTLVKY